MRGDLSLEPGEARKRRWEYKRGGAHLETWVPERGYEMRCRQTYQIVCTIHATSAESEELGV